MKYDQDATVAQYRFAMTPDMVEQRWKVRAALGLQRGERVLEVGCGNGLLVRELAEAVGPGGHVSGADLSDAMIAMTSEYSGAFPNVGLAVADAIKLPYRNSSFDAAVTVQCLCFVSDVAAALAEFYRVLRPGGRLVILDTDWDTLVWNSTVPELMDDMMSIYQGIYADARLPRTLSRLLRSAGFEIQSRSQFSILNWSYEPDSYSGHQLSFMKSFALASIAPGQIQKWENSIQSTAAASNYFFSLSRFVFSATKPA